MKTDDSKVTDRNPSDPDPETGVGAEEGAEPVAPPSSESEQGEGEGVDSRDSPEPELTPASQDEGSDARESGEVEELEVGSREELEALQEEMDRLRDQHLRLAADFENYRKRASADLSSVWTRAQAELVRSLVEGLDDLQRVSQFTSDDTTVEALIEGVDLVERNLLKGLKDAGLEVLEPVGERFDPNTMEAMMRVPTGDEGEDETVHQVFQKGYLFKDQLVRPARVSVYKDDD